jgi:hypothetical protein
VVSRGGQGILRYGSRACGSLTSEKDTEKLGDVGNSSGDGAAHRSIVNSPLSEITLLFVRFDHVVSCIVNTNHSIV